MGTNAALKGVTSEQAAAAGVQLLFCNTYHLLVHPGADVPRQLPTPSGQLGARKTEGPESIARFYITVFRLHADNSGRYILGVVLILVSCFEYHVLKLCGIRLWLAQAVYISARDVDFSVQFRVVLRNPKRDTRAECWVTVVRTQDPAATLGYGIESLRIVRLRISRSLILNM